MPTDQPKRLQDCLASLELWQNELEDTEFTSLYNDHVKTLLSIKSSLSSRVKLSPTDANKLLIICLRYMKDVRFVLNVFSIVSELLDIDKDNPHLDFLPFGLAILKFLNTKCHEDNTTSKLQIVSLRLLFKHPKSALLMLIRYHSELIIKTLQPIIAVNQANLPSKIEAFKVLKMLEWLPTTEKRLFVEAGLSFWFADVIPAMIQILESDEDLNKIEACMTYTELLANELVHLDYYENPHFTNLYECTANEKLPATIMGLLNNEKDNWYRILIVLIKILKNYLTRPCADHPTPLNTLLPIIEAAFKKEPQRVLAFACWNELIQSIYFETGTTITTINSTIKKIKLLLAPLKISAKTEEIVVAKFQTWWYFLHKCRPIINDQLTRKDKEKYTIDMIISFLNFMFGKHHVENVIKTTEVSDYMRKRCIEGFADIVNFEQIDDHITEKMLLDYWKVFTNALKSCIWAVAKSYTEDTKKQIQYIWISLLTKLAAMADNTARRDMFDSVINTISELILENENIGNENLMEELVDDITLPLWRDNRLKTLTMSRSQSCRPMHRIVKLTMDNKFNKSFERFNSEELTTLLQPLVSTLLEESISKPEYIFWLLDELLVTYSTLVMWTALAQASKETKLSLEAYNKILLWPFKAVNISFEVIEAAKAWYNLYNIIHEDLEKTDFYNEISKVMKRPVEDSKPSNCFVLFALIGVLEHKPDIAKMEKLEALTNEMNGYNDFEQLLTPLVKSIVMIINNSTDENLAHITINCVENMLMGIHSETEALSSKSSVQNRTMLSDTITSTLKDYFEKCPYQSIKNLVRSLITSYDKKTERPKRASVTPKNVTESPKITPFTVKRKKNKNVASILAKVIDKGEEYAVIKSNWKFNPKKLTENQKEKLQRKKADIPALYADQSQSQDFNLAAWKTDSQDTSMSSSKSETSNDVTDTLKKITNANIIVPKIMGNILNMEKDSKPETDNNVSPTTKVNSPKVVKLSTPGNNKSARMTLKDRVCRNVRNLIGNSSPSPQDKVTDKQEDTITHQNVSQSPLSQPENICIESPDKNSDTNKNNLKPSNDVSATDKQKNGSPVTSPSTRKLIVSTQRIDEMMRLACTPVSNTQKKIRLELPGPQQSSVERPARLKKTPKKFDDTLVLPVKKRQYSKNESQDLLERHTETNIAQIYNRNDKMEVTDANSPQKVSSDEADTNENAKKSPTSSCALENVTRFAASDDKSHKYTEKSSLISSKTSINKANAKINSPKTCKETNVQKEITSNDENAVVNSPVTDAKDLYQPKILAKTSVLINNTAKHAEKEELVSTIINKTKELIDSDTSQIPLRKSKELQKTPKKVSTQHDIIPDHMDTPISLRKLRKSKVQKEITAKDKYAPINTRVKAAEDLNQPKLLANSCVLLNDTKTNAEKVEVVSTPINKTKKDSDIIQLPLSKSKDPQKSPKKVSTQHDKIPDSMDTPISLRKLRMSNIQKEISPNDENAALNTPVTADKVLIQPKLSVQKRNIQNDADINVVVVPKSIKKTKKDTSLLKSAKRSNIVKTKEATQDKVTQKKVYDVETEQNKDEENLLSPETQKKKKLRIEKKLAIDMVEGHPFLKTESAKMLTRKKLMEVDIGNKRKTMIDNMKQFQLEITPKISKKDKKRLPLANSTIVVDDSQYKAQSLSPQNIMYEPPCSEDVIESSQESTMTTISVKAKMRTSRIPVVALEKIDIPITLENCTIFDKTDKESHESTDIVLPHNKSVESDKNVIDTTENMDTEPIADSISTTDLTENMDTETLSANETNDPIILKDSNNTTDLTENMDTETISANKTDDLIIICKTLPTPVTVNSESELVIGPETQELAEADTQPNDPKQFETWEINKTLLASDSHPPEFINIEDNDITQSLPEAEAEVILSNMGDTTEVSSSFKDDNQRKQDFLNNTVEISPIKVQSPDRQKKSSSPETSIDFVVIHLSSPVQGNGEPFDKQSSPEFFTEDKLSPDLQNASPPRVDETVTNSSSSASLSLKKNRPQVNRPISGRAAQMLASLISTNERQPVRAVFDFKFSEDDCSVEQNDGTEENFLKLQRSLPTITSSPSGPILKRKLDEITEDSTASPASKRKRVSFHDPPVSTTVVIQKYLEPISLMRSPQSSTKKRQTRSGVKSPKKLVNSFLESALSTTVESFTEATTPSDETENISLDVTPVAEIVKTSELNDTDPICPGLIDCSYPIDVIAIELSSAAMRDSFVKDLKGKVHTVGDLAKMTELEVNRLSIKAPKITVAKKVLTDYLRNIETHKITGAKKILSNTDDLLNCPANASTAIEVFSEPMTVESLLNGNGMDVEMQTDECEVSNTQTQLNVKTVTSAETQTEIYSANTSVQTVEPYYNEEAIKEMLADPLQFNKIKEILNQDQMTEIAELLPEKTLIRLLMKIHKSIPELLYRIIKKQRRNSSDTDEPSERLAPIRDMLIDKFDMKDLGPLLTAIMASKFS